MTVTEAAPYHLLADPKDASEIQVRRTRGGDAFERLEAAAPKRGSLALSVRK